MIEKTRHEAQEPSPAEEHRLQADARYGAHARCDNCRHAFLSRLDQRSPTKILECLAAPPNYALVPSQGPDGRIFVGSQWIRRPVAPDFVCGDFAALDKPLE